MEGKTSRGPRAHPVSRSTFRNVSATNVRLIDPARDSEPVSGRRPSNESVQLLLEGGVDMVYRDHRSFPRVRFKALGLVVIDEEQRFGRSA